MVSIERAREVVEQVTAGIEFPGRGSWAHLAADSSDAWSRNLLGRLAVAVGEQEILFTSGKLEHLRDVEGYSGEIVVFTVSSVVVATFSARRPESYTFDFVLDAQVRVLPRTAITAVRISSASPLPNDEDESWIRRLVVVVEVDGQMIALDPPGGQEEQLSSFVSSLFARAEQ